jgi:hypothetical protein
MPLTTPTDPEHPRTEPETAPNGPATGSAEQPAEPRPDANAPLSFVPHDSSGALPRQPVRIRTGRYGELDEHELLHLLDSIEDERARGRFRESIYISFFIWIAIAWIVFYGPRYLWHAPRMVLPSEVLRNRELTQLNAPIFTPHLPAPRPAPKIDNRTLEHLRSMEPPAPHTPPPPTPKIAPTPTPPITSAVPPAPSPVLPLPSAPQPAAPRSAAPLPAAPAPQPNTHPSFNTGSGSDIERAMRDAARHPGAGGSGSGGNGNSPLNVGGVEVLSDTQNVDFDPYIRRLIQDIYRNWLPLIPEEAKPPLSKQGETLVRFRILPDGRIGGMWLDGSTHDDAINRSCWGSITSEGQFPPLPSQFHGPNLELRIHYYVNKQP